MPTVQAEILHAVLGLDDSLGISTLTPDVRTVGLHAIWMHSIEGFYETQTDPAGELAALLVNLISFASGRSEARASEDLSSGEQWLTPCR
jgi:hypothetical protein